MAELRVRIEAILRRVALDRRPMPPVPVSLAQSLRFDDERSDVFFAEQWAGLTRSEYRLLDTLHRNGDEVLSKAFLYQHVLQRGYAAHDRSLDMHVSNLRKKIGPHPDGRPRIVALRSRGYYYSL